MDANCCFLLRLERLHKKYQCVLIWVELRVTVSFCIEGTALFSSLMVSASILTCFWRVETAFLIWRFGWVLSRLSSNSLLNFRVCACVCKKKLRHPSFPGSSASLPHIDCGSLTPANYMYTISREYQASNGQALFPPGVKMRFRGCDHKWSAKKHLPFTPGKQSFCLPVEL